MGENEPLSPDKVSNAIQYYIRKLSEATDTYAQAADEKAEAEAEFKRAWAQARTDYRAEAIEKGWKATEAIVDDHATLTTFEALKARLHADAVEEATKLAVRSLQSRLDATRSLGANLREVT